MTNKYKTQATIIPIHNGYSIEFTRQTSERVMDHWFVQYRTLPKALRRISEELGKK